MKLANVKEAKKTFKKFSKHALFIGVIFDEYGITMNTKDESIRFPFERPCVESWNKLKLHVLGNDSIFDIIFDDREFVVSAYNNNWPQITSINEYGNSIHFSCLAFNNDKRHYKYVCPCTSITEIIERKEF